MTVNLDIIKKHIYAFVGCNGSGKTTLVKNFLSLPHFSMLLYICPDSVVKEKFNNMDINNAYTAAMNYCAQLRHSCVEKGDSFIFETVLSTDGKLTELKEAKARGYQLIVFACVTDSSEINKCRIGQRVIEGGHGVPIDKIEPRYLRSSVNICKLSFFADTMYIYDNSKQNRSQVLIYYLDNGAVVYPNNIEFLWLDSYKHKLK